jgi:hypothetical protein
MLPYLWCSTSPFSASFEMAAVTLGFLTSRKRLMESPSLPALFFQGALWLPDIFHAGGVFVHSFIPLKLA